MSSTPVSLHCAVRLGDVTVLSGTIWPPGRDMYNSQDLSASLGTCVFIASGLSCLSVISHCEEQCYYADLHNHSFELPITC